MSRPRCAALRAAAAGCGGALEPQPSASEGRPPAAAGGRGGGAKRAFILSIRPAASVASSTGGQPRGTTAGGRMAGPGGTPAQKRDP